MALYLIGIDDTDNAESSGTGQLARRLVLEAVERGAIHRGITRHQFLLDPRIPSTRQNRGVCIAIEWNVPSRDLDFAVEHIAEWSVAGSDPGICITPAEKVASDIIDYGRRASTEVLELKEAISLAMSAGITLRMLGGTGEGIIGALSAVGLRAGGNDGRFVDLPGLRELGDEVSTEDLSNLGIEVDWPTGDITHTKKRIKTLRWVRPRLINGRAVLPVNWSNEHDAWIPIDQKRIRDVKHSPD